MGHFLNKTGRPIMYSCEWPLYMRALGAKVSRRHFNNAIKSCDCSWDTDEIYLNYTVNILNIKGSGLYSAVIMALKE